jgi:uncharacterized protein (TIGR03435 family)
MRRGAANESPLNVVSCNMQKLVLCVFAAVLTGYGQNPRLTYEAATIKPNASGSNGSSTNGSKGQIVFTNATLKRLIERAYEAKPIQVTGPSWLEDVRFDITAKYPPETKQSDRSLMLRTLLEDRFGLVTHPETKELPGYSLLVGKGGLKVQPAETGDSSMNSNGDGRSTTLTVSGVTMPEFADYLTRHLAEFVVDRTGAGGKYAFKMRWASDEQLAAGDPDPAPSLFTALQEVLGLKLQPQKVPVKMVVVDKVERAPTEN